jgi:hypothetical protein
MNRPLPVGFGKHHADPAYSDPLADHSSEVTI